MTATVLCIVDKVHIINKALKEKKKKTRDRVMFPGASVHAHSIILILKSGRF